MWELDCEESWAPKNWWLWIAVLEKTLESPLDCKEIKPVNPKGNQPWIFIGRTGAEAPILWPLEERNQLIEKDPDAGKDWGEENGATEDELVGWPSLTQWTKSEQTQEDSERQGSLACCSSWGCKELGRTQQLGNIKIASFQKNPNHPVLPHQISDTKCAGLEVADHDANAPTAPFP